MQQLKGGHMRSYYFMHVERKGVASSRIYDYSSPACVEYLLTNFCSGAPLVSLQLTWPTWFHYVSYNFQEKHSRSLNQVPLASCP